MSLGYEVIALDLPGHGRSPIPGGDCTGPHSFNGSSYRCFRSGSDVVYRNLAFRELCADVLTVFDLFSRDADGVDSTINVLVAHSYGTSLALHVAHERPEHVHRLVLISGGAPVPLEPFCWPYCLPLCCFSCLWTCVVNQFRRNAFGVRSPIKLTKPDSPEDGDGSNSISPRSCSSTSSAAFQSSSSCSSPSSPSSNSTSSSGSSHNNNNKDKLTSRLTKEDIENSFAITPIVLRATMRGQSWPEGDVAYHRTIEVPTLLLIGDRDRYVTVEEEGLMLQTIPCSIMRIIHGAGHMIMLENPDKVSHHIQTLIMYPPRFSIQRKRPVQQQQQMQLQTKQPEAIVPPVSD